LAFIRGDLAPERLGCPLDLLRIDGESGQRGEELAALGEAHQRRRRPHMRVTGGRTRCLHPKTRSRTEPTAASQW
jgi:hypothetical protein